MERISSNTNEVDLITIAAALWAKRNVLIASTLSFVVAGILVAFAQTPVYQGRMQISPLSDAELTGFYTWNSGIVELATHSQFNLAGPYTNLKSTRITADSLFDDFLTYFRQGTALNSALQQNSKEIKNFNGNALELSSLLNSMRKNFLLEKNELGEATLTFKTTNRNESIQILSTALDIISQDVKKERVKSINAILAAKAVSQKMQKERLSIDFEAHRKLYELKKEQSLALLREQASVARILNFEKPLGSDSSKQTSNEVVNLEKNTLELFESTYFLLGYSAIEKQIANVADRDNVEFFFVADDAEELILARERLARTDIVKILEPLVDTTPLRDPDFMIVRADLDSIGFASETNKAWLASIISLVGFLISIFATLFAHAYQVRFSNKSAF